MGEERNVIAMADRKRRRGRSAVLLAILVSLAILLAAGAGWYWLSRTSAVPNRDAVPTWESITLAAARGDRPGVLKRLAPWLDAHPDDGRALLILAGLLSTEGKFKEARAAIGKVRSDDPYWVKGQQMLGPLEMQTKNARAAESVFKGLADREPTDVASRKALVYLYSLEQRHDDARLRLWELYRIDPKPETLVDLTMALLEVRYDVRAMGADLQAFAASTPDDPFLQAAWGLALFWSGKPDAALPKLDAATNALENAPVVAFADLDCRRALGFDVELDRLSAETVLGPRPSAIKAEGAIWDRYAAKIAALKKEPGKAIGYLKSAVEATPLDREANHRLARALIEAGRAEEAKPYQADVDTIAKRESDLKRAVRQAEADRFPNEGIENVAKLCIELGYLDEADAWRELAVPSPTFDKSTRGPVSERLPLALSRPLIRSRRETANTGPSKLPNEPKPSKIRFEDVAEKSGVNFRYDDGAKGDLFIVDTMGGGVGLIDYDGDGRLDLYFVNGCRINLTTVDETNPISPNKLYRNRGDGTFEDVTFAAKVGGRGYGMGCTVGDYDNDGRDDLFVTGFGATVLYHNLGNGRFEDATKKAGVGSSRWTTAGGFGDFDQDGDLDLYVVTYVDADPKTAKPCRDQAGGAIHCSPGYFTAQLDQLFQNNGDGTFRDVSQDAGIEVPNGRGLGLALVDLDSDGKLDIFVANDASPNFAFRNLGGFKFEEIGMASGLGVDGSGKATASMGVVASDLNSDGLVDLFHTNFLNEGSTLRLNLGHGLFVDATSGTNLDVSSRAVTGFGAVALDIENDGRPDLFVANGHVDDQVWVNSPMAHRPLLYSNNGSNGFRSLGSEAGPYFGTAMVGRGVAAGDLDRDGLVDLVVVHRDRPVSILRNVTAGGGNWLTVELRGTKSGKTPIGARVVLKAGKLSKTAWVTSGTSYLSSSDRRLHFGIGTESKVDSLEITWPSGQVQTVRNPAIHQNLIIEESNEGGP